MVYLVRSLKNLQNGFSEGGSKGLRGGTMNGGMAGAGVGAGGFPLKPTVRFERGEGWGDEWGLEGAWKGVGAGRVARTVLPIEIP